MDTSFPWKDGKEAAEAIEAELNALPARNTESMRAIRRKYSQELKSASPEFMLELARQLVKVDSHRWIAFELIAGHAGAFRCVGPGELEEFSQGMNSWWRVDEFARTLAGPAWLHGQVSDDLILAWAGSADPWRRRAALVSTVAWNVRSKGGPGDVPRTLRVCELLAGDHEDMVVKALSWALRELVPHDPAAVEAFLQEHDQILAGRVKREVKNKIKTGLKNPKQ